MLAPMSFPIPDAALAQHIAILGKTGSGKTVAAKGMVERLLDNGARACAIDPTGVWYGLRLTESGKRAAYPVVIFGGPHGDVPLSANHGEAIAEIIGTSSTSAVIDASMMKVSERTRFFADFADALVRKNKGPLHLVIDEAHLFMPQGKVADPASAQMLHAANNLVSLGRSRGLRITIISQRPAKVHKDSLTQIESLVAMRLIAPQDRNAVEAWIEDNADDKRAAEVIGSLATLKTGEAWLWAPELGILDRVKFPKNMTFDSSRAPEGNDSGPTLTPIDLASVNERLATIEAETKANDPRTLKAEIARLKSELAKAGKAQPWADAAALKATRDEGERAGKAIAVKALGRFAKDLAGSVNRAQDACADAERLLQSFGTFAESLATDIAAKPSPAVRQIERRPQRPSPTPSGELTAPQQRVMSSLAFWLSVGQAAPTREQVAAVAGYRPGSGNFNNIIGSLSTLSHTRTPAPGRVELLSEWPTLTLDEARDRLWSVFENPQRRLVESALKVSGDLSRDELATASGYAPGSGNFNNICGSLTSMDVLCRTGQGRIGMSGWAREVLQ